MEFTYTAQQLALRERARALTEELMAYELPCEENGGLPPGSLASARRETVLDA